MTESGAGAEAVPLLPVLDPAPGRLVLTLPRAPVGDRAVVIIWALTFGIVLYLGIDGGGYAIGAYGDVWIAVWWGLVVCACAGLLPRSAPGRPALAALAALFGFVAWTALAVTWSISHARSLQDLSLVVGYLGIFTLSILAHRERRLALATTIGALAAAITVIAVLAVVSRLWPGVFPAAREASRFLMGTRARLSWPLDYWNALAALMDFGVPLLLVLATSARRVSVQVAAAAALPVVVLCAVLTLSRDGVVAGGVAVVVFYALAPNRIPKLATGVAAGVGAAVVVTAGLHRHAIQQGLTGGSEHAQAASLLVVIVLASAGVAALQAAIAVASRRAQRPALLRIPVKRARTLTALAILALVLAGLLAGAPHRAEHAWHDFKSQRTPAANSTSRFGSTSGDGRYQYWKAAIDSLNGHVLTGSGPGTFQLDWLPRAPFESYVTNAHSLYIETLAEEGAVGLALLVVFFLVVLAAGARRIVRARPAERIRLAGVLAAVAGFLVFAAFDWIWQVAVLPAAFMLTAGALLAPGSGTRSSGTRSSGPPSSVTASPPTMSRRWRLTARIATAAVGLAGLVAIAIPLASSDALSASEAAAASGHLAVALRDARRAIVAEPDSAAAQLQLALILEQDRDLPAATAAASRAVRDEPDNWADWLTLSRLEVEVGDAHAAVTDYERARSLNPRSPLFAS